MQHPVWMHVPCTLPAVISTKPRDKTSTGDTRALAARSGRHRPRAWEFVKFLADKDSQTTCGTDPKTASQNEETALHGPINDYDSSVGG